MYFLVLNYLFFNIRFLFLVMCLFESILILEQPHLTIVLDLPVVFDISVYQVPKFKVN
jgi:hypothetical protein